MVALIDCNNFYVSCERLFDAALENKPVIVLSNNDGCAISRSEEAKALGIQMAQPAFLLPAAQAAQVRLRSSNYALYGDMSARVMQVIRELVPETEVYSIDEIFADLSSLPSRSLPGLARRIREEVMTRTGIPVTVGLGATKTLAKMANRFAKKERPLEGVFCADTRERTEQLLCTTEVGKIWGIGPQQEALLRSNGFNMAIDLLSAPEEWIRKQLSVVGLRLVNELRGIPCIRWEPEAPTRKNICTSRSFGKLVTDKKEMRQAVAKFTASCAEKLRRERSCARKIQVFIQTNPHRPTDRQYFQSITVPMDVASNLTMQLMRYALIGLDRIFQPGYLYQKCGVVAMDLVPQSVIQGSLFEEETGRDKERKLMSAVDAVNRAFPAGTVRMATQDYGHRWKLKQQHLSPLYTTRFDQLPKAKAN